MAILGALIALLGFLEMAGYVDRIWRRTPGSAQKTTAGAKQLSPLW